MIANDIAICRKLGNDQPRVALIHCSEKVNEKFPHTLDYVQLKEEAQLGRFGSVFVDGPMDAKTACDRHSGEIKGLSSPVIGNADIMIFRISSRAILFIKHFHFLAMRTWQACLQEQ